MTSTAEIAEHVEFHEGDLVSFQYDGNTIVGRVSTLTAHDVYVRMPDNEESWDDYCLSKRDNSIVVIGTTRNQESDPSLFSRIIDLRHSVRDLEKKLNYSGSHDDWRLMSTLRYFLTGAATAGAREHLWFWRSIAESLDNPRMVSYAAKPEHVDNDARRVKTSIAKLLKGIGKRMGATFTDEEADRIGELWGENVPDTRVCEIELVQGPALLQAYKELEVPGNCMQRKPHVQWYAENPAKVELAKVMQGGQYIARALVWTTDSGDVVIDRCYSPKGSSAINSLHKWADAQGYDYKIVQSYDDGNLKSGRWDYKVTLNAPSSRRYPYLDTFKYTEEDPEEDEIITLRMSSDTGARFDDTEGSWSGGRSRDCCDNCGAHSRGDDDGDYVNDEYICQRCLDRHFAHLDYRDQYGRWVSGYYSTDETCECSECGNQFLNEDTVEVGDDCYCFECHEEKFAVCDNCSGDVEREDATSIGSGVYCPDCVETCKHCDEAYVYGNGCECEQGAADHAEEMRRAKEAHDKLRAEDAIQQAQWEAERENRMRDAERAWQGSSLLATPVIVPTISAFDCVSVTP